MMGRIASWFAVAWTAVVGAYLLYGPVYATESVSYSIGPTAGAAPLPPPTAGSAGLLAVEGPAAYARVLLPLLAALAPLLVPRAVRPVALLVAAVLLGAYAFLGLMSIGLLYVPPTVALFLAAFAAAAGAGPGDKPAAAPPAA